MKKIVVTALCIMLLTGTGASAVSEWAKPEAEIANATGLVTESLLWGSVRENITREEFCYLAMNLYKNMGGDVPDDIKNPFSDTENQAVSQAYAIGIVNGKTPDMFYPDAPITRQEIAKIIMLTVNSLTGSDLSQRQICEICRFDDFEEVEDWAMEYVNDAVRHNLITGVSATELLPAGNATREQAIVIMKRAYENFSEREYQYKIPQIHDMNQAQMTEDTFYVSWDEVPSATDYTVILRDRDRNILLTEITKNTSANLSVKDLSYGQYSVLVGARVGDFAYVYSPEKFIEKSPGEYVDKYPTQEDKMRRVFPGGQAFTEQETAKQNMKTITVPVWSLDANGNKSSSRMSVDVNANIAEDIVKIFTEIYNDPERFPIKNLGGFSWRKTAFGSVSEHSYGTCIDINWDENYYCYASNGQAITGSFWKPYENPFSIPPSGSVVRAFKKYGFKWGGEWKNLKDYMHFTYLGR